VAASFGERLKKEREKRGMTLEDVAGATKISVRNLRALEQEKFDAMPGGIFNRGFVRAYAKHLGLDDDQVVADYMEAASESVPGATPAPSDTSVGPVIVREKAPILEKTHSAPDVRAEDDSAKIPWAAVVGLVVLGTVLLGLWSYHSHGKADSRRGGEPATATHFAEASPNPQADPGTANGAMGTAQPSSSINSGAQNGTALAGFDVALHAHDEVWLSSAVDGKPPSESIMEDGQSINFHASERAILKVGNAAALDVVFNGQKVPVRAAEGEVRTLTFTASGLQTPAPPQKPN